MDALHAGVKCMHCPLMIRWIDQALSMSNSENSGDEWEEINVDSDIGLLNHEQRSWMQMATMKGSDIQTYVYM